MELNRKIFKQKVSTKNVVIIYQIQNSVNEVVKKKNN